MHSSRLPFDGFSKLIVGRVHATECISWPNSSYCSKGGVFLLSPGVERMGSGKVVVTVNWSEPVSKERSTLEEVAQLVKTRSMHFPDSRVGESTREGSHLAP